MRLFEIDNKLVNDAIKLYGITPNCEEAGYILPDGRFLDFSGRHQQPDEYTREGDFWISKKSRPDYMSGSRYVDHRHIAGDAYDGSYIELSPLNYTDGMIDFMLKSGCIRLRAGNIQVMTIPTKQQIISSIYCWRQLGDGDPMIVEVGTSTSQVYQEFSRPTISNIMNFIQSVLNS